MAAGAGQQTQGMDVDPQVRTLLLTDIVDSTALVERLGDSASANLFRAHDRLVLELQQRWRGRLIDRSDGLLLIFGRALDGLGFALDYIRGLRGLGEGVGQPLRARAGLHVGEVLIWENPADSVRHGAKPVEVEGLAKPLAGRLMAMARPDQILLSAVAEPLAHRAVRELGERGGQLVWKSHGRWKFKGVPESQEVFEVGEPGLAPLRMPASSPKAWRDLPLWRRPGALVAEAVVLGALAIGAWTLTRPQPAIAFEERDWVLVGDLRNLTGDARLDDALEQAFRISLEQSRHVNVLSDLKVRETLDRMQRPPGTAVDRAVGAEIALRDGARAVILPTVAEVGGRLRVSVEVVDPQTLVTVYALSADGRGVDSALASIDQVTGQLRGELGEALQSVRATSVPLPKASTPSIDALRLYAMGQKAAAEGRGKEAMEWYQEALRRDPQFALAMGDIGVLHVREGMDAPAKAAFAKALALPSRLSPQDADRFRVWQVWFDTYEKQVPTLKRYVALYPDDPLGYSGLRTIHRSMANDWPASLEQARLALAANAERRGLRLYSMATGLLGLERYQEALKAFDEAREEGFGGRGGAAANALDALRRYEEADRLRTQARPAGLRGARFWHDMEEAPVAVDRGRWRDAALFAGRAWGDGTHRDLELVFGAWVASCVLAGVERPATCLDRGNAALSGEGDRDDRRLLLGVLAASSGDRARLEQQIRALDRAALASRAPVRAQLFDVLLAERERLDGKPQAALQRLAPVVAADTATIAARAAMLRAAQAAGDVGVQRAQIDWLRTHRGRAFLEESAGLGLQLYNLAQSNLALLADCEIAKARGDTVTLQQRQREMAQAWPNTDQLPPAVAARWRAAAQAKP